MIDHGSWAWTMMAMTAVMAASGGHPWPMQSHERLGWLQRSALPRVSSHWAQRLALRSAQETDHSCRRGETLRSTSAHVMF
jgi:hypothetical protein